MTTAKSSRLTSSQKYTLLAVTLGNALEWYDIYLYIYWAPTLSRIFFGPDAQLSNLFNVVAIFALGFFLRPLAGIAFGMLGDHLGRKQSFILSILFMTIPTFVLGLLPTYAQIGILAPILLTVTRVLQIFPSGGELPGVFCYLYESADVHNRKFMTSFAGVGTQLGVTLGIVESLIFDTFCSEAFLTTWGWRISFMLGGLIGLTGYFLRYTLHETKLFQETISHHMASEKSLGKVVKTYWKSIIKGMSFGATQTISFHVISILLPVYLYKVIGVSPSRHFVVSLIFVTLMTVPLPLVGLLSEKIGVKKILLTASLGMIFLLYPLCASIHHSSTMLTLGLFSLYAVFCTCITALWPYLISHLFPTKDRYTCLGLSFNMVDGALGGVSTLLGLYLLETNKNLDALCLLLFCGSVVSLVSYIRHA